MKTIFLEVPSADSSIQIMFRTPVEKARIRYESMQKEVDEISHPVGHESLMEFYNMD